MTFSFSLSKVLALLITLLCIKLFSFNNFFQLLICISLGHYLLGLINSKEKLKSSLNTLNKKIFFGGFCLIILFGALFQFPNIVAVFGIHYALSEAYIFKRHLDNKKIELLSFLRFISHLCFYFSVINYQFLYPQSFYNIPYLSTLLITLILLYFNRNSLGKKIALDILVFDLITLGLFLFTVFMGGHFNFLYSIFYHVISWWFIPILTKSEFCFKKAALFLMKNLAITVLVFIGDYILYIRPGVARFPAIDPSKWMNIFRNNDSISFWGYFHILLSPYLSDKNPKFVVNLIRGSSKQ